MYVLWVEGCLEIFDGQGEVKTHVPVYGHEKSLICLVNAEGRTILLLASRL